MPVHVSWEDLALRLVLTLIAGAAIGFNRERSGHWAGLRTVMLVCLAASLAMMQANLLVPSVGKAADSFVTFDLMRFPLGILTGVGFIGAGAILRRGETVQGLTTAATLWFVTVIGLCFGGGQIWLGIAGTAIGFAVLWAMKWLDESMERVQRARMTVKSERDIVLEEVAGPELKGRRVTIRLQGKNYGLSGDSHEAHYEIRWRAKNGTPLPQSFIDRIRSEPGISAVMWHG